VTLICLVSRAARYSVLGAVLGSASPAGAELGQDPRRCSPLRVEADAALLDRWPELAGQVRLAFADRNDTDACARVSLSQRQGHIEIEVMLGDGRSASRLVPHARDVVPTLQGLLLLPEPEGTAVSSGPPERAPGPMQAEPPVSKPPPRRTLRADPIMDQPGPPKSDRRAPAGFGLEVSLVGGAHIGDGQTRSSVGGLCVAELWSWLAGFEVRAANYTPQPGTNVAPYSTFEFALLGGHRFRFEPVTLDFTAGPSFMLNATESVVTGPDGTRRSSSTELVTRLRMASHVNFAPRSLFGPFVGVEGELGPAERSDAAAPSPAPGSDQTYPGWMVGVVLGATVGTR
jgi:hypothetical protein